MTADLKREFKELLRSDGHLYGRSVDAICGLSVSPDRKFLAVGRAQRRDLSEQFPVGSGGKRKSLSSVAAIDIYRVVAKESATAGLRYSFHQRNTIVMDRPPDAEGTRALTAVSCMEWLKGRC